jgi:hypothetical protein
LNIIKKQNPKYKEKRRKLACEAANIKAKLTCLERDNPELLPILYEKKRRWKTAKRYMMKNLIWNLHSRSHVEIAKVTKWKKRHQLAKENKKMTIRDYIYFYHSAYDEYFDEYMEATFYEEGKEVRMYEFRYENWYEQWNEDRIWEAMEQERMKKEMQEMNSSIWDLIQEAEYIIEYRKNTIKFLGNETLKKSLEEMYNTRVIEYHTKEKKRN